VLGIVLLAAAPAIAGTRTTLDGIYTQEQADRGFDVYRAFCSRCHQADLNGTGGAPPLHTSTFTDNWREGDLAALFHHIQTWMPPQNRKGTLPEQQYLDVMTYILWVNEFPAGATELKIADLHSVLFVDKDGARALPPSATIRAIGCLMQGPNWSLARVGEVRRVHDGSEIYELELAWSRQFPLGSASYQLPNLPEDRKESDLIPLIGRKVQVKGVLKGTGANQGITVFSIELVDKDPAAQCAD
jgi:mono/diheme cytochrome c family protein